MDKQDPTAEIEENNRMNKIRDHFKKIRDIKGIFLKLIYFLLKDNCFTEFCHFLSNLNMNQP